MKNNIESAFLTLTERTVNDCYRNPLNFVSYIIFLLASLTIAVLDFTTGVPFLIFAVLLLIFSTVNCFAKSNTRKASAFKALTATSCILLILCFGFEIFSIYFDYELPIIFKSFSQSLPSPFNLFVNHGINFRLIISCVILSMACIVLLNSTLIQSTNKNVLNTKPFVLLFILLLVPSIAVILDGLAMFNIIPSNYTYCGPAELELISNITAILPCFILAVFCILQAIRSLVIYKKLRKVKNAL